MNPYVLIQQLTKFPSLILSILTVVLLLESKCFFLTTQVFYFFNLLRQ